MGVGVEAWVWVRESEDFWKGSLCSASEANARWRS